MKESKFKFKIPYLRKIIFLCNEDYNNAKIKLDIKTKTYVKKEKDKEEATVSLDIEFFELESLDQSPYYINVVMDGDFKWEKDLEDDKVDNLLKSNAPAILLSYMRPYLSNLTTGAGYPPLILPLLDFTENEVILED